MDISKPELRIDHSEMSESSSKHHAFSFTGSGGEYFKIWIVNILLTIVTLYIYSAWAKVRTKRYFHGNTILDSSSFEYHAKPLQILLSRMIAAALLVAVTFGDFINPWVALVATVILFLIIPWAIWRSTKFNTRMVSYRNVRFGFDGSVWPLYLYQLVIPLIGYGAIALAVYAFVEFDIENKLLISIAAVVLLSLNLLLAAFTHHRLSDYFINHYLYGKSRFSANLSLGVFHKVYLIAAGLGLGTFAAIAGLLVFSAVPDGTSVGDWIAGGLADINDERDSERSGQVASLIVKIAVLFYAYLLLVGYYLFALVRATIRNHVLGNTVLDKRVKLESDVPVTGLWWVMFSNLLLVIVSLGFARPYTQVRMAKFLARHTKAVSDTPLDDFVGEKRSEVSAFGDELGDAFDMDMDVGF